MRVCMHGCADLQRLDYVCTGAWVCVHTYVLSYACMHVGGYAQMPLHFRPRQGVWHHF